MSEFRGTTTFVPRFLDGSIHDPQRGDAYIHVRLSEPDQSEDALTAYLADGTAIVVKRGDLLRLAPVDPAGTTGAVTNEVHRDLAGYQDDPATRVPAAR